MVKNKADLGSWSTTLDQQNRVKQLNKLVWFQMGKDDSKYKH